MSFKRDGDDTNLLGKLRKRRITELLSEDIPEDEAKLLCNGRFTCTVCPHNPIFDTVNMLTVHRTGKKHLSNQDIRKAKKRELNHLIAARKHEQYLKDGTTSIRMAKTNDTSLLTSCPYDPRVKKAKVKRGDRKPTLDLAIKSAMLHSVNTPNKDMPAATRNVRNGTSGSLAISDPFERCLSGPFKHTHQLKDIFKERIEVPLRILPYNSKFRSNQIVHKNIHSCLPSTNKSILTGNHSSDLSVGSLPNSNVRTPPITSGKQATWNSAFITNETHSARTFSSLQYGRHTSNKSTTGIGMRELLPSATPPPPPPSITSPENCTLSNSTFVPDKMSVNAEMVTEQSLMSQKLRRLQGSGWKRDWDGKWIKDKDAEFDSDEEAPDVQ